MGTIVGADVLVGNTVGTGMGAEVGAGVVVGMIVGTVVGIEVGAGEAVGVGAPTMPTNPASSIISDVTLTVNTGGGVGWQRLL